jgi:hypothetical protein
MFMFAFAMGLSLSLTSFDTKEIVLSNVDSRHMIKQIQEFMSQSHRADIVISAAVGKNAVVLTGSGAEIAEMQRLISLFDVRSSEINLDIVVNCPNLNWTQRAQVQTMNNAKWTFEQESASIAFSIWPRVNADGTVTFLAGDYRPTEGQQRGIRIAPGDKATFCVASDMQIVPVERHSPIPKNVKAIVTITFSIPKTEKIQNPAEPARVFNGPN